MPIIKSLKTEYGRPHRVHRSKKGREPARKYHAKKIARHYRKKLEDLTTPPLEQDE